MKLWKRSLLCLALASSVGFATACDKGSDKLKEEAKAQAEEAEKDDESAKKDDAKKEEKADKPLPFEATGPVAVIDGEEIPAEKFNEMAKRRMGRMRGLPPQLVSVYKKQILDRVIDQHLVEKVLSKKDIKVEDKAVDEKFAEFREKFPNDKAFEDFLSKNEVDVERIKSDIKKDLRLREHLREKYGFEVTEKAAKEFYEKNPKRFDKKEQVHARHILIKAKKNADEKTVEQARKKAEAIAKEAKKDGTDFAKLAKDKSEGPSAVKGGDLGFFPKERMVPGFSKVAFEMDKGEISDPVRTQFGFHVIKVEDKKPARTVPFDEAKEDILKNLERRELRTAMQKFMKELKKDVKIERKQDNIQVNVETKAPAKMKGGAPGALGGAKGMPKDMKLKLKNFQKKNGQGGKKGESK